MSTVNKSKSIVLPELSDPVKACKLIWPNYTLYDKQQEILYSLRDNFETIVPAGNDMGKDFITGMAVLWYFVSRRPCRIVTTSVDNTQLQDVLWGEIRKFAAEAAVPLPIEITGELRMYQTTSWGGRIKGSECIGRVSRKGEGMLGRHAAWTENNEPTTLLVVDEASGVDDEGYDKADTWAHRILVIGNPYKCNNFFFRGSQEGDRPTARPGSRKEALGRKVIRIKAVDSPNVRLGLAEVAAGKRPSYRNIIPGLLSYDEYLRRRATWDKIKQTVSLDAEFYEGEEVKLYPPAWIANSHLKYSNAPSIEQRTALGIGIDPAEGGDSTCFAAVDEYGLIRLLSMKTPNTAVIKAKTLAFMRQHGLDPHNRIHQGRVCFDRGGGGKQHADYLRQDGYSNIRTIGFGEAPTLEEISKEAGVVQPEERVEDKETRYAYKNRRAEMAGLLSLRMDPKIEHSQFSYSSEYTKLTEQLRVIPRDYDGEGKMYLLPKNKRDKHSKEKTLIDLIGHSPDEMDAVMLAVYSMEVPLILTIAGAV